MPLPVGFKLEEEKIPKTPEILDKRISGVPEGFTLETNQELGDFLPSTIPGYMRYKYYVDKAQAAYAEPLDRAFWGNMSWDEAIKKGNKARDYWMAVAGPYENLSLKDISKHPVKFTLGESAALAPYMISSMVEGAKYAAIMGPLFAGVAFGVGKLPPLALFPEEFITMPMGFKVGAGTGFAFGSFKNMMKREGASFTGDMIQEGMNPKLAQVLGLGVGTINWLLELSQFRTLSKPFKQAFSRVLKTKVGKNAITQVLGRYVRGLGINILQEDLQEVSPLVAETIGWVVDDNPNAIPTKEEWKERLIETTVRAGTGLAAIGIPGATVDILTPYRKATSINKAIKKGDISFGGDTFEENIRRHELVRRKMAGEELTTEELATISSIYDKFVEDGLIPKKEEAVTEEGKVADIDEAVNRELEEAADVEKGKALEAIPRFEGNNDTDAFAAKIADSPEMIQKTQDHIDSLKQELDVLKKEDAADTEINKEREKKMSDLVQQISLASDVIKKIDEDAKKIKRPARTYPKIQRVFTEIEKAIIRKLEGELYSPGTGKLIRDDEGKVTGRMPSERIFDFLQFRPKEPGESKKEYNREKDRSGLRTRQLEATFKNVLEDKRLTNLQTEVMEEILAEAKVHSAFQEVIANARRESGLTAEEANRIIDESIQRADEEKPLNQLDTTEVQGEAEGKVEEKIGPTSQKAAEIAAVVDKSVKKKLQLLYQGREKQLDQRRVALEEKMTLLEKQIKLLEKQKKPFKAVQNQLDAAEQELETIYFQIADLEDTAAARFKKEGILLGGKDLEQLRKLAFRRGEVALRKDLLAKIKARKAEKARRARAIKTITKQPKKPENVTDVKYQKKINAILEKLGDKSETRKKNLNAMTTNELVALAAVIADLKIKGRKIFSSNKEQKKMASEIMRAAILKAIGGLPDGSFIKGTAKEEKLKKATLRQQVTIENLRPIPFIREIFGKIGEILFYDSMDYADTQEMINDIKRKLVIENFMKDKKLTWQVIGRAININGVEFQLNQVMRMYIAKKDKHSMEALLKGHNLTEEMVDAFIDYAKKEYPEYIKLADTVQKVVAAEFNRINDIMETYYNVSMEKVDVYFPLHFEVKDVFATDLYEDLESYMMYEQAARKGEGFVYTSLYKKFAINREKLSKNFNKQMSLDFMGDAFMAITQQEHMIAYASLQKAFNQVIQDKDIREAVTYNFSEKAWKDFNKYLLDNISPYNVYTGSNDIWSRFLRYVRKGIVRAFLPLSVTTAAIQLPSMFMAMRYAPMGELINSFAKVVNPKSNYKEEIYKLDPSLKNRVMIREHKEVMDKVKKLPRGELRRRIEIASAAMDKKTFAMMLQFDKYAVLSIYDAVYQHKRKTLSETEAKYIAHKAVLETQPQGGIKDLPALYRSNKEYLRLVLLFTNQLNQYWSIVSSTIPADIREKEYHKAVSTLGAMMLISTSIYMIKHGRLPEDPLEAFEAIFGTLFASIPLAGNLGMSLIRGYTPSFSPLDSLPKTIQSMIGNAVNKNYGKAMEKALFLAAILSQLGFGYSQIRRTIKGAIDLKSGETDNWLRLILSEPMMKSKNKKKKLIPL